MSGIELVTKWCWQFVGRAPSAQDIANGEAIDAGSIQVTDLLPAIMACDECYAFLGTNNASWLDGVFSVLTGRQMPPEERESILSRLASQPGYERRLEVARRLVAQYPYDREKP